jgi:lipid II:glycine glycyltransferase (peptidoglycan interpeptide bridge formation enzyme)
MKRLHKDARWGINRAIKEGLVIERSEDWDNNYWLYKSIMEEGGSEPVPVNQLKSEAIALFLCKKQDKVIAGASLKIEDGRITLHTNFSLKEYQYMQPNNLLYWECIKSAKLNGFKELDLGGWQINAPKNDHISGINKFKEKWGKIKYFERDYPMLVAIGRKAIKKSNLLWKINKKLKGRK